MRRILHLLVSVLLRGGATKAFVSEARMRRILRLKGQPRPAASIPGNVAVLFGSRPARPSSPAFGRRRKKVLPLAKQPGVGSLTVSGEACPHTSNGAAGRRFKADQF
mgnify:CR=1 FL=1|jgi:hypothetical protein